MTRYHLHFFLSYNGRFLEVSSEQRKMKISSNRAFSIITYLQWKIVQESAKAPVFPASIQLIFFLLSIKIAQLVSIKQHHMTNTPQRLWLLTFCCSIDRFIHPFTRVCPRISLSIHPTRRYKFMEKGGEVLWYVPQKQSLSNCYVCAVVLPVVWFTKSSQWHKCRTCVLLARVKYVWDALKKQVVGWYL